MKRRDLLKAGFLATGSVLVSSGCKREEQKSELSFADVPKQKQTYEMYVAMPFDFKLIDKIDKFNSTYQKSKITTFYQNIPYPLFEKFEEQFQSPKGYNEDIKTFDDFAKYVKYVKDKGFKFVYVLNSPKPFSKADFTKHSIDFYYLINKLHKLGCDEIKIANHQLMKLISEYNPDINLSASTSFEYHNITQYINLLTSYPQIKSLNTAIDDNRNLEFLGNLKKRFPKINIELMVNEKCVRGCPARISHASAHYEYWDCRSLRLNKPITFFLKQNAIYPWWLPYYQQIGINTFKFYSFSYRAAIRSVDFLESYLNCIEYGTENVTAEEFLIKMFGCEMKIKNNVKLSEIMPYLPDIKHFLKNGNRCDEICDVECNYCLKNAHTIEKILGVEKLKEV